MRILKMFCFVSLVSLVFFACKDEKKTNDSAAPAVSDEMAKRKAKKKKNYTQLDLIKNMKKVNDNEIVKLKRAAQVIWDHRTKESDKKSYVILDKALWAYEFIFSGKEMTKPGELDGNWIDFHQDLKYTYGKYDEKLGTGIYTYSIDSGLLLLIDDSDEIKPQEFKIKIKEPTLLLTGNEIYRDNNYQAKLTRTDAIPTK